MKKRLLSAGLLFALFFLILTVLPHHYFIGALSGVVAIAFGEWLRLSGYQPLKVGILAVLAGVLFYSATLIEKYPSYFLEGSFFVDGLLGFNVIWWVFALSLFLMPQSVRRFFLEFPAIKLLCGVVILLSFFVSALLLWNYDSTCWYFLYPCLLVWATDSGAYFAGKQCGKHLLAPYISPKKTWEGVLGGCFLAGGVGVCLSYFTSLSNSELLMGWCVCVPAAVVGDLTESLFKRLSNVKNSGTLIPGHGGILDRIDGLIAAVPVFAYMIVCYSR